MLLGHISTVVSRYAGKFHSWDVVNEAIDPADRRPDNLRNNSWLKFMGPGYIETAFRAAAQADPSAMLVWNENWMEEETSYGIAKRTAWLQHLRDLLNRNVPIHAIGIQSHLVGDHTNIAGRHFQQFLRDAGALGLKILITEMDVQDNSLPADVFARDQIIGNLYYQYMSTVLKEKAVIAVLNWGLSNAYSWMVGFKPRADGNPVRPLPLDHNMAPTPAYQAMMRAFGDAPAR
jgi:endo-1,4-beta-xylanase